MMTATKTLLRPAPDAEPIRAPRDPWLRLTDVMHVRGPEFDFVVPALELPVGRLTAVVGPNGSGKSTLLSLITGAIIPQQGSIRLMDDAPGQAALRTRSLLGMQLQGAGYNPHFKVEGLMRLHRVAYAVSDDSVFTAFGIPEIFSRRVAALSSGQLQRLQLAMALAHHPLVALFDEPSSALDPFYEQAFIDALARARIQNPDFTALFVTHSRQVVGICDDLLCLKSGRVVEQAPKAELLARLFGEVGVEFETTPAHMKDLLADLKTLPGQRMLRRRGARVTVHGDRNLAPAALAAAGRHPLSHFGLWDTSAADLLESFKDE